VTVPGYLWRLVVARQAAHTAQRAYYSHVGRHIRGEAGLPQEVSELH